MAGYNSYSRNNRRSDDNFEFRIIEHIGVLAESESGWRKEVNLVAWNGNAPKIDIREWQPDHTRMSRGITMQEVEAVRLVSALSSRYNIQTPVAQDMAQNGQGTQEHSDDLLTGGQINDRVAEGSCDFAEPAEEEFNEEDIPFDSSGQEIPS